MSRIAADTAWEGRVRLQELAGTILGSHRPFTRDEQAIVRAAYGALAQGSPVPQEHIADAAGLPADVVSNTFSRWPGLAQLDQSGRVVACLGLSLERTMHRFEVGGRTLYTWCAWDTLFIPRLLRATADVASRCPITGVPVRAVVTPDGVADVHPSDTTVSFVTSCSTEGGPAPIGVCCRHIHFLGSVRAAPQWLESQPSGVVLSLDEAWELGRIFVDARFSDPASEPVSATS